MASPLEAPISRLKGIGPRLSALLARKGVCTLEDALYFLPRDYEDRRRLSKVGELTGGAATVCAAVVSARWARGRRSRHFEAVVSDGTGHLKLSWFHAFPSIEQEFSPGSRLVLHGDVRTFQGELQMTHPEYERVAEDGKPPVSYHFGRVVPVYSETEGLHQKPLRRIMGEALKASLPHLDDCLPEDLRGRLALPGLRESFIGLHFPAVPPEPDRLSAAGRRVVFEEFFILHLGLGIVRRRRRKQGAVPLHAPEAAERFVAGLPFPLTGDQRRAIDEVSRDLAMPQAMTRLIQGDVGAGKTVVALAAAAVVRACGKQAAVLAPTEILAAQHHQAAERWLGPLGVRSALVLGGPGKSVPAEADLFIGTHALFQADVSFERLALVVVDEQHRFGVDQRGELLAKGMAPATHLLMMTATPIPRTLALTLYGDLDVTLIREKPATRKPIRTSILGERQRPALYRKIRETVSRGEQVYIIYPLVEASEKVDLKSATEMHQRLSREVFADLKVGLLHGRMKAGEKDAVLAEFRESRTKILVSTTVIEVGIDVAAATLMVVEHPDRLGLSQLHQLRGRVGRGERPSECVLVASGHVTPRLRVLEQSDDGFEIAEEDLRLRGPGEFLGTRQSGLPGFRVGNIVRDADLLTTARDEADRVLGSDPELAAPEHRGIRERVERHWKEKIDRLRGG